MATFSGGETLVATKIVKREGVTVGANEGTLGSADEWYECPAGRYAILEILAHTEGDSLVMTDSSGNLPTNWDSNVDRNNVDGDYNDIITDPIVYRMVAGQRIGRTGGTSQTTQFLFFIREFGNV